MNKPAVKISCSDPKNAGRHRPGVAALFVMCKRRIALFWSFFAPAAAGAICLTAIWPIRPVDVKVVQLETATDTEQKWVELRLEFSRQEPHGYFFIKGLTVETKVGGCWAKPERFFGFIGEDSLLFTNRVSASLMIPREAKACRFVLAYHIGGSPRSKAEEYFFNHGWMKRCPEVCQCLLRALPGRVLWKRTKLQLALLSERQQRSSLTNLSHNPAAAMDVPIASRLHFVARWRRATGQRRSTLIPCGCHGV
jgi:hypothetical protein